MNNHQSVRSGRNSESYLSANDINITNIGNVNSDEERISRLSDLKSNLRENCERDFESLSTHVLSNSQILEENGVFFIEGLDSKVKSEIEKNKGILDVKIKDIATLEDKLLDLGLYDRHEPYNTFNEVNSRVEKELIKFAASNDFMSSFRKNIKYILIAFLFFLLLYLIFLQKNKIDKLSAVLEHNNFRSELVSAANGIYFEHGVQAKETHTSSDSECLRKADALINDHGYVEENRNSNNLWLIDEGYKLHIKCYTQYGIVVYLVIGENSEGVEERLDKIWGVF